MASATDKQILEATNKRLGTKYKSVTEYLTDNGKLDKTSEKYKRRLAAVQNERGKATRQEFVAGSKWTDYIKDKYGWLVSIYNSVPEVADIIRNAYVSEEPADIVANKINNSSWALNLQLGEYDYLKAVAQNDRSYLDQLKIKERNIKNMAAKSGYAITDEQAASIAASAQKGGWDEGTTQQEINKTVVGTVRQKPGVFGAVPAPETPTELQQGNEAVRVRNAAKQYGISLTDKMVEGYSQALLNGSLSQEQVLGQFRQQAKSLYPSLASQLDSGSLEDSLSSYKTIAANTLGVDDSSIDFTSPKFGKLLTYQDPKSGESRLMNATEWKTYLRGLPDWQSTEEAKRGYSNAIKTVESLFGKVR